MKNYIDFSKAASLPTARAPLPDVEDKEGAPFWEGTRQGEIRFPRCRSCNRFHWYPCVLCPFCHSSDIEWQAVTGQPKLFTWTYVNWDLGSLFQVQGPYIAALAEFDDAPGVRLVANLVDCQPGEVYIGMPLEVVFQQVNDKLTMPLFKPIK